MKKLLAFIAVVCLLLFAVTYVSEGAEASSFRTVKVVTGSSLVVKNQASPSANTIATLKKGEFVTVFSTANGWSKIESKGVTGFVNDASLGKPKSTIKIASSKSGLVVKNLPTTATKTVATLKYNMIVEDFGSVGDGWSFVQYGNVTGYVNSKFIGVAKTTNLYTAADVAVRNIASPSGEQVATIKAGTNVVVHSTLAGWSYVTMGDVKGYVVAAQLTAKKPAVQAGLGFYQGLVPIGLKNGTAYDYFIAGSQGYGGSYYDRFTYTGSKAAGNYAVKFSAADSYPGDTLDEYSENAQGFTFKNYMAVAQVDYPVKVGNKKTYKATVSVFDMEEGALKSEQQTFTSTVKVVNATYTVRNVKVPNAVVIEVQNNTGDKVSFVFQLNKGLVFADYYYIEEFDGERYDGGEILQLGSMFGGLY